MKIDYDTIIDRLCNSMELMTDEEAIQDFTEAGLTEEQAEKLINIYWAINPMERLDRSLIGAWHKIIEEAIK